MSFRSRLLFASVPLAVLPVVLLAIGVRREVDARLRAQYHARVDGMLRVVEGDVERESQAIALRLAAMADALEADNRLRLMVVSGGADDRQYLLDYAGDAMRLAGLDVLQVQDSVGRILSSGHFRNDFDRVDAAMLRDLRAAGSRAGLAQVRVPEGSLAALVRLDSVQIGPRTLFLIGGTAIDSAFLSSLDRGADLTVALAVREEAAAATSAASSDGRAAESDVLVRTIDLPVVGSADALSSPARIVIAQSLEPLRALRRSIDVWFAAATAAAAALALLLASWIASRMSSPIVDLARRTQRLDLDRLDVDFPSRRRDEIGTLARTLDALTQRLRASVARVRVAERRATVGDLARQVNHDVRNGLTPIRNVVNHLTEVARDNPTKLSGVFLERQPTLDASIAYLHSLAGNYARLSPRLERRACDANAAIQELLGALPETDRTRVRADLAAMLPAVTADPVALRRIIENLVTNALESVPPEGGAVVISTRVEPASVGRVVRVVVSDNGPGMSADQMQKIFDDFYTTKQRGTGLGLSIVRRLVSDLGGSVRADSEPGKGARFTVELPCADSSGAGERDESNILRAAPVAASSPSAAVRTDGGAR